MEDLRRFFSSEAIKTLENLKKDFQSSDTFSALQKGELFRTLHTVKGSSQTFGFDSAAFLAHNLESLLSTVQSSENFSRDSKNLFVEGIGFLINSLESRRFAIPDSFLEKISLAASDSTEKINSPESFLSAIPTEIASKLSSQEKNWLVSALSGGKNLFCLEIVFDSANFAAEFKKNREILSESGEIIATLPGSNNAEKLCFQFIFTSFLPLAEIKKTAELHATQVISGADETAFSNDLQGILSQIVKHGKTLARKFDKQIEFAVSSDEIRLSASKLKLIFDVLTHLIRNAVDHGVEKEGKIEIGLKIEEDGLRLSVADDGRGIDLQKIKNKAVEKNLISGQENLIEQRSLELIFLPGFSTASKLTEISGRGIGLDAVKNAVEKAGGKINIKKSSDKGTTFEIFLPENAK